MTPLFQKLNLKDQAEILVLNAPGEFESELSALEGVKVVRKAAGVKKIGFAMGFVTTSAELEKVVKSIVSRLDGDGIVWMAYPKTASRNYKCEFNRDSGWTLLGEVGFEPVRQVAIDEDWSALRFRRVEYIKKMTRAAEGALTSEGKVKTTDRGRKKSFEVQSPESGVKSAF
jgi:hypothetical protein